MKNSQTSLPLPLLRNQLPRSPFLVPENCDGRLLRSPVKQLQRQTVVRQAISLYKYLLTVTILAYRLRYDRGTE